MDPTDDRRRESADATRRFASLRAQAQSLHEQALECTDPRRAQELYRRHAEVVREMMGISQFRISCAQKLMRRLRP